MRTALSLIGALAALGCGTSYPAADAFVPAADAGTDAHVAVDPDAGPPPCTGSADCADPARPVCDLASRECVVCDASDRGACGVGEYCDAGECAPGCATDADCAAAGGPGMRCRASDHACVGCVSDEQCALGTVCEPATSTCVAGCTSERGCASADEACCDGACLDTSADVANCGGCGLTCSGTCAAGACTLHPSCAALQADDPTLPSGAYDLDPDGAGPGAPVRVYCDMTTDGGGWILVAVIRGDSAAHSDAAAVGTLSSPSQTTVAKLSDADIDRLRGVRATSVIRFECGASVSYFQEDRAFDAAAAGSGSLLRCSTSPSGPWETATPYPTHYGLNTYAAASCPYMIYYYAERASSGCYAWSTEDPLGTVGDSGLVWIRPGAPAP